MRRIALGAFLLSITIALAACGSTVTSSNRQGNKLYSQGKYDEALSAYQKAQAEQPDLAELHYNVGNTLHRKEDYQEAAAETLQGLSKADPDLRARAYCNLGNSFYRQTDKVNTEVESPVSGIVFEILYPKDTVVKIGEVIARIEEES